MGVMMGIDQGDVKLVKDQMFPDEAVAITVRQRRVGPGGSMVTPTSVIVTNKRLIIVNKESLGMRKDIESIPYKQITSVRLEHGIISSSVFVRVEGYDTDKGFLKNTGKQEGEIEGLKNNDAKEITEYINNMIAGDGADGSGVQQTQQPQQAAAPKGKYVFCSKCGARMDAGAKFCDKCGTKL